MGKIIVVMMLMMMRITTRAVIMKTDIGDNDNNILKETITVREVEY